jgi:4-amino-4-deoxychorismate lyase
VALNALTWVDGEAADSLPLPDRGLDYGDGLFETLLLRDGSIVLPELHWQRLARGLDRLGFPDCSARVHAACAGALRACTDAGLPWASLRVTVTRGGGPRGYVPPGAPRPRVVASVHPVARNPRTMLDPARLGVAAIAWSTQPVLAGIKHLNRLEQVLAAAEVRSSGWDEALMLDQDGEAISVTTGNLFAVSAGVLLTPPLRRCGIAGTRRARLLASWAPAIGVPAQERALSVAELRDAEEVFYCNSLVGLRPVGALTGRCWDSHPVCEALHQRYLQDL